MMILCTWLLHKWNADLDISVHKKQEMDSSSFHRKSSTVSSKCYEGHTESKAQTSASLSSLSEMMQLTQLGVGWLDQVTQLHYSGLPQSWSRKTSSERHLLLLAPVSFAVTQKEQAIRQEDTLSNGPTLRWARAEKGPWSGINWHHLEFAHCQTSWSGWYLDM